MDVASERAETSVDEIRGHMKFKYVDWAKMKNPLVP